MFYSIWFICLCQLFLAFKKSSSVWVIRAFCLKCQNHQLFIATKTRPLSFPSQLRWVIFFSSYLKECHLSNICQLSNFCQYQQKLHAKCVYMEIAFVYILRFLLSTVLLTQQNWLYLSILIGIWTSQFKWFHDMFQMTSVSVWIETSKWSQIKRV